jgi:UTP--glucose-1-phosphate uridylyltransferase
LNVTKAVVVAAGYGTRFLPVTRCVPKEMLPIIDRPAIDLVIEELVAAGIEDVLVVTSRRKKAMEDWFDRDPELEALFHAEGATDKLERIVPPRVRVTFVRQQRMAGTGDAILLARSFAGSDPVVVAYPDDLFEASAGVPNCTAELVATWRSTRGSVLACGDLVGQDVSRYGVLDVEAGSTGVHRVRRLVEKPRPGAEPSTLVSWGRYLFTPELLEELDAGRKRHAGAGEYYHVDALNEIAARGRLFARVIEAERHDTGTPLGYLQTVIGAALARPELGPVLATWLQETLARRVG